MAASGRRRADDNLTLALASGMTVEDAASKAGVSERTAYRRLDDPEFRRRVVELQAEVLGQAAGQLAQATIESVTTLRELLGASSDHIRLNAARAILQNAVRLREATTIELRIQALEAFIEGRPPILEVS